MFVLIQEFHHDHQPEKYYVDSTKLNVKDSVLDKMLSNLLKKKAFTQELYIDFQEMTKKYPNSSDFIEGEHPGFTESACFRRLPKGQIVEKHVDFHISYG